MIRLFLDCCLPSTRSGGLGQESHRLVGVQGGVEEAVGFDGCTVTLRPYRNGLRPPARNL